jgi:biopolymer transport protein ExbD
MAGVDLGGGRPQKKAKGGGLKRPKHRIGIRIDMTPMVDIAFLLLIFYMVTTIFSSPLSMEISLPPKQDIADNPPVKVAESKLLLLYVDKTDSVFYQIGKDMKQPAMVSMAELEKIIDEKNRNVKDLVMVLKIDQKASYKMMVNIIDAIQGAERGINANPQLALALGVEQGQKFSVKFSLQDMNAWDEHVLEVVKTGGTVE